jgi:hypothetical protein
LLLACLTLAAGCAHHKSFSDAGDKPDPLASLVVPLAVNSFEITNADNQRGVFFKLSRIPDSVTSHVEGGDADPAQILIEVDGPGGGEDLATQTFPGTDTLVSQIHIARTNGRLQLGVELSALRAPPYTVHQMADWIMVRINPSPAR